MGDRDALRRTGSTRGEQDDPVSALASVRAQNGGEPVGVLFELTVGEGLVFADDRRVSSWCNLVMSDSVGADRE